jgi:hypothetical protein
MFSESSYYNTDCADHVAWSKINQDELIQW